MKKSNSCFLGVKHSSVKVLRRQCSGSLEAIAQLEASKVNNESKLKINFVTNKERAK